MSWLIPTLAFAVGVNAGIVLMAVFAVTRSPE